MGRLAWIVGFVAVACAPPRPSASSQLEVKADPPAIARLAGYRTRLIPESVFRGFARWLEVGPTDAPPLLLIHGIGEGGVHDFQSILPALAEQYHVYAVDVPGFGNSSRSAALYSPERYVRFLHEAAQTHLPRPINLVGHSMGGAIALLYAHHHPRMVSRLVLIDAAGILHREALTQYIATSGIGHLFEPAGRIVGDLTGLLVSRAPGPEALLENDTARSVVLPEPKQVAAAALIVHNFGPPVAETRVRTLLIWGRNDFIAPLRTATLLAARLPHVRLEILERSGHVPMDTEPELLASQMLEWLHSSVSAPSIPWPAPVVPPRFGRCDQSSGVTFEGVYQEIQIVDCKGVRLSHVQADSVQIWDSEVTVESSQFRTPGAALIAVRSKVELTGCVLSGGVALHLDGAELDAAGSDFWGQAMTVYNRDPSRILFSASRLTSALGQRYLHEGVELSQNQSL